MSVETVVVHSARPKSVVNAEGTHFHTPGDFRGSCAFHALRVYVDLNSGDGRKVPDLSPQPKNISISKSGCQVM